MTKKIKVKDINKKIFSQRSLHSAHKAVSVLSVFAVICQLMSPMVASAHNKTSVSINDGDQATMSLDVSLTVSYGVGWVMNKEVPTQMRFANIASNKDCNEVNDSDWSVFEAYASTKSWGLAAGGTGNRKVCVQTKHGDDVRNGSDKIKYEYVTPNPELSESCGLDISLVLDSSGSIDEANLDTMKEAFNTFVNTFIPGTPTQFSVVDFDDKARLLQAFSGNVDSITPKINEPVSGGATNWQDALLVAQNSFTGGTDKPNLVIFASDGNPTVNNGHDGNSEPDKTNGNDLTNAIAAANSIKANGTRIITLAVGNGISTANLEKISSPDAVYLSDFDTLASDLADLANDLCGGTITVQKIIDADGDLETVTDQTYPEGWTFGIADSTEVTGDDGYTSSVEVNNGTYEVSEEKQIGYGVISASCTDNGNWNEDDTISGINVGSKDIVTCKFYNSPEPGTLTVIKRVVNEFDGTATSSDAIITVAINGEAQESFNGDVDGTSIEIPAGAEYSVSEEFPAGYAADIAESCSGTMAPLGDETCVITNTQIDPKAGKGAITVVKSLVEDNGGDAEVSDFTLKINDTEVESGQTNYLDPDTYSVSEVALSGYENTSTVCMDGDETIATSTIELEAGDSITCTVANNDIAPSLTLTKIVENSEVPASNWTVQAFLGAASEPTIFGSGHVTSGRDFMAGTYTLNEVGEMTNFESGKWDCGNTEVSDNGEIILKVGDEVTCTITNTYVKSVDDSDKDGADDKKDNCIFTPNADQVDADGDGIGDVCDNCPGNPNLDQADADGDGTGDVCEADTDGDEIIDDFDNCVNTPNHDQADSDGDGVGDACEKIDGGDDDNVNCGNSFLDSDEVCDGDNASCVVDGYVGTKSCNTSCSGWNACQTDQYCGDGIKNGTEECDGGSNCKSDCTQKTTINFSHPGDWAHSSSTGGVKPQVAGAEIDLDEIQRLINEIRARIAQIAAELALDNGSVLGAATEVSTGVLD